MSKPEHTQLAHANETHSLDFFSPSSDVLGSVLSSMNGRKLGFVTCDVNHAQNAGEICRLLANFAPPGSVLRHVISDGEVKQNNSPKTPMIKQGKFLKVSCGTHRNIEHVCSTTSEFCDWVLTGTDRPPLVVIETARGAKNIHEFAFPPSCEIMVGGETMGVNKDILDCLVDGYDSIVYIPMPGFCKS